MQDSQLFSQSRQTAAFILQAASTDTFFIVGKFHFIFIDLAIDVFVHVVYFDKSGSFMMYMLNMIEDIVGFKLNDIIAKVDDLQVLPYTVICPVLYELEFFITPCVIMCGCLKIVHITQTVGTIT